MKEKDNLLKENKDLKEEIDTLHDEVDDKEDYTVCDRESKHALFKSRKKVNTSEHNGNSQATDINQTSTSEDADYGENYVIVLPSNESGTNVDGSKKNSTHTSPAEPSFESTPADTDSQQDYSNVRISRPSKPRLPPKGVIPILRVPTLPKRESAASNDGDHDGDDDEESQEMVTATVDSGSAMPLGHSIKEAVVIQFKPASKDRVPGVAPPAPPAPPAASTPSLKPEVGMYSNPRPGAPIRKSPAPPPRSVSLASPAPKSDTKKKTSDTERSATFPKAQPATPSKLPKKHFKLFSTSDVGLFLEKRNLGKYAEKFNTENIDGDLLLNLDRDILVGELGMSEKDAQKLIISLCDVRSATA